MFEPMEFLWLSEDEDEAEEDDDPWSVMLSLGFEGNSSLNRNLKRLEDLRGGGEAREEKRDWKEDEPCRRPASVFESAIEKYGTRNEREREYDLRESPEMGKSREEKEKKQKSQKGVVRWANR